MFKLSGEFRNDYVIINSAPLEFGHILLLPEVEEQHRQSLTLHALRSSLHLLRLSGSSKFKLMFNSLQGGASVNHLHIHGMYSRYSRHSDDLPRKRLHSGAETSLECTVASFSAELISLQPYLFYGYIKANV